MIIPDLLLRDMLDHVQAQYPEEACGLVAGREGRATAVYPIENLHHSPVLYEMAALEQIQAMLAMETAGDELLAIFHSHPSGPARPSQTDIAQAYYPDSLQIIISLADRSQPVVRAFTIVDGHVSEVEWSVA